jgi:hypothetical protein
MQRSRLPAHLAAGGILMGTGSRRSISRFHAVASDSPEIHCRVSTPWPPGFGVPLQFTRTAENHGAQKPEVARRKRVGFPKCPHSHVLCRPLSNSWNFAQPIQQSIGIHNTFETDPSIAHSPSEDPDCLSSSPSQSDAGKLSLGKDVWCGE